ncbi:hypothetical protein ABVK25_001948 [Lepraria finkii]|uniref:PARP-type domain-containing protein n=1 Tax=Lepraria finkii TaxID=1340010 RepID=A0ABR4BIB8_9LECA
MSYRVEISPSNRAGCQNSECKKEGIKIPKGALRCGVFVTIMDNQTWKWKHWGCVTPKQVVSINEAIENDVNLLDGLEELPEDIQEKIKTALAEGHVADEDWNGDIEMNRPGMNGYRTPASKKARREEAKETLAVGEGESPNTSKPPSKKRGQPEAEPGAEDDHDQVPAPKKRKAAPKKARKTAEDDMDDTPEDDSKPAKKSRKNAKKPKDEVEATVGIKDESSDHDAVPAPPAKKMRAPRKSAAAKKIKDEKADDDAPNDTPEVAKKITAPQKSAADKKIKDEETENGASNDTSNPKIEVPVKRTRAPRKASATKKIKEDESDVNEMSDDAVGVSGPAKTERDDEFDPEGEDDGAESTPKPKKGGKKAANGKAAGATPKAKAKPKAKGASNEAEKPKQTNGRPKRGQN